MPLTEIYNRIRLIILQLILILWLKICFLLLVPDTVVGGLLFLGEWVGHAFSWYGYGNTIGLIINVHVEEMILD